MTFSGSFYGAQRAVQQLQLETSNSFSHKTKYFVQFTIEVKILKGKQFLLDTSNLVSYPQKCAVFLMVNWSLMSAVFSIRLQKPANFKKNIQKQVLKQKAQILHNKIEISMQNNFLNFAFYLMLPISNLLLIGGAILITRALFSGSNSLLSTCFYSKLERIEGNISISSSLDFELQFLKIMNMYHNFINKFRQKCQRVWERGLNQASSNCRS